MERESFVFYRSFFEAIRLQPKKIQADIYNAVLDYAFSGNEPDINSSALSIFLLIKPQIDANNKKFENGKKGSEHGAKGGRPRKEGGIKTPKGLQDDETEKPLRGYEGAEIENPKETPNEECRMSNVNVNDNEECVMGNDNENEKHNYQLIADMYNAACASFPKCTTLSEGRKKAIRARLNKYSYEDFRRLFEMAEESDFLKGANKSNWSASFDWLIKDTNMAKVLDGNYANKAQGGGNPFMELYNEMG